MKVIRWMKGGREEETSPDGEATTAEGEGRGEEAEEEEETEEGEEEEKEEAEAAAGAEAVMTRSFWLGKWRVALWK